MAKVELSDLGVTLQQWDEVEDDQEPMYIVSNTDELSMRKMFPLKIGDYTFANRDQLVAYVAQWIAGNHEQARAIVKLKKKPSAGYSMPADDKEWRSWAPAIAYVVATNAKDISGVLVTIPNKTIGASGKDDVWELGQDKTTAERSAPPHPWGMNAWGKALTKYRDELVGEEVEEEESKDVGLEAFLSSKLEGKELVATRLSKMMIGRDSLWSNEDAVENFMITYRRAIRTNTLDQLRQWIKAASPAYIDAWSFVATLPLLNSVNSVIQRDAEATRKFIESLNSVEKCKKCGGNVQAFSQQMRSADEPEETMLRCFNLESGCARRDIDRESALPIIHPYVYRYRERTGRALLK
jgi:DNA-directed RNA polymerase subunit M/transcription elongation factor TFIIS